MNYRHGDVNLISISKERFEAAKRAGMAIEHSGRHILARGEATGSVHELSCADMDLVLNGETLFLRLNEEGKLTHTSDHETLIVEPDYFVQVPEREVDHYQHSVIRKVVD